MKPTAADKLDVGDKAQLLRNQMDETYFACETLSWELNNRLNTEDSIGKYFDTNTIGLSAKLRSMYESIILGDPQCLANEAERLMWQHCFQQFFDPISRNAKRLNEEYLRKATELLHIATNYYFCLIRKIAKAASAEIEDVVLLVPKFLPRNTSNYDPQDAFVVEITHRMYIHMGDIVRYRSAIFPTVVYRAYPTAEKLYQYALSLKSDEGATYSRLALLYSSVGRNIDAAYYHLRGSLAKVKAEEPSQYLTLLLMENERHYYLSTERRNAINKRRLEVDVSDAFIRSTLHVVRYVYSSTAESQNCQLPAMVEENIHLLYSCFRLVLERRFPGFVYGDVDSDTVLSLVTMQMTLIELLEKKNSKKRPIVERWLLSVFRCVTELVIQLVKYAYSSVPSVTGYETPFVNAVANGGTNRGMTKQGRRKENASRLETTSGYTTTARIAAGNDKDLAKDACVTVLRKLEALRQINWMKVLKVICDWLRINPDRLRKVESGTWIHFVSLMNLLPTEAELCDLYTRNREIGKELKGSFCTPLSEWSQSFPLPEDAHIFKTRKPSLARTASRREMDDTAKSFLRVCCFHKCVREFVRHKFTGLRFDNWTMKFVPSAHAESGSMETPLEKSEKVPLDYVTNDRALKHEMGSCRSQCSSSSSRPRTFVIVDGLSLCRKLSSLRELVQSNQFTVVICISVIDQLYKWKAGMHSARRAIGWIEYEWAHSNRALMIRTNDSRSKKWEGKSAGTTLELVRMYGFLAKESPYETRHIVLLTDYSSDSAEFEGIYTQAAQNEVEGKILMCVTSVTFTPAGSRVGDDCDAEKVLRRTEKAAFDRDELAKYGRAEKVLKYSLLCEEKLVSAKFG